MALGSMLLSCALELTVVNSRRGLRRDEVRVSFEFRGP